MIGVKAWKALTSEQQSIKHMRPMQRFLAK